MKMLYEARMQDLGPGDFVRVECAACGHEELIPAIGLQQGMRLPPDTLVLDLKRRMRCRECDAKGRAVVSIRWAEALRRKAHRRKKGGGPGSKGRQYAIRTLASTGTAACTRDNSVALSDRTTIIEHLQLVQ
jgi:hypothetical protein